MLANNVLFLTRILAFTVLFFPFFFNAREAEKDNLPQLAFELWHILTFSFSLFSLCYIHSSAANSISTLLSLPLTTLITYYTSVYSLCGNSPHPALQQFLSKCLYAASPIVCVICSAVLLSIVRYKMVVMPEAPQSKGKEANKMCREEWWREARREVFGM